VRVTFRAQFAGPIGVLNTLGLNLDRCPPTTVEVFRRGNKWYARECDTKRLAEFWQIGSSETHGTMKDLIAATFTSQVTPWTMFDTFGNPLDAALVEEDPKGDFRKIQATHIAHQSQMGMPGNQFKTECGITANAPQIRSKRGQQPPTCPECRKVWETIKEEMRLKQA